MDVRERLKMLLEGDESLRDLNTNFNTAQAVQPVQDLDRGDSVDGSVKAKKGVSGYALPVDFDPEHGMEYPESGQFPLSYIRTYVIGQLVESDDDLTEINQDDRTPGSPPKLHLDTSDVRDDESGEVSDEAPVTAIQVPVSFTPAATMARYPFKYLHGSKSKRVNERFYVGNKFWNRSWDLYYLPVPMGISQAPFLLIPTYQAQALLDEINSALKLRLTLTGVKKEGLVLEINNEKLPRPLFLGRSSSPDRKARLENHVPLPLENWGPWTQLVEPHVFEEFEKKVKQSIATIKHKNHKQAARDAQIQKLRESLARAQSYFGLRPALQPNVTQPSFANGQIDAIDVLKPVKWAFHDAPIFISVDLEWMERYEWLTEVGISTLDMRDLEGVVPGDYGQMWLRQVRSRHLRVAEYRHWVNNEFLQGCPNNFRFGESEFLPGAEVAKAVDAAFHPPYMVPSKDEKIPSYKNQKRTVILVGFDPHGDISHLQKEGSKVFNDLNHPSSIVRETLDVAELYRINAGESQKRSLRALLGILNILCPDLHNAGNDAYYTLHALVRLMLRVAGEKPWGYESAEVSDEEPKVEPKDNPKVTIDPKDKPKFESIAAQLEKANDNADGSIGDAPVWRH